MSDFAKSQITGPKPCVREVSLPFESVWVWPVDDDEEIVRTICDQIRALRPGQTLTVERREQETPSDPSFTVTVTDVVDGSPE